jgi:hypothetical protein
MKQSSVHPQQTALNVCVCVTINTNQDVQGIWLSEYDKDQQTKTQQKS